MFLGDELGEEGAAGVGGGVLAGNGDGGWFGEAVEEVLLLVATGRDELVDGVRVQQAVDSNRTRLAHAIGARDSLRLARWVQLRLAEDDGVGGLQVYACADGINLCAEDGAAVAGHESVEGSLPIGGDHVAGERWTGEGAEVLVDDGKNGAEVGEDQDFMAVCNGFSGEVD